MDHDNGEWDRFEDTNLVHGTGGGAGWAKETSLSVIRRGGCCWCMADENGRRIPTISQTVTTIPFLLSVGYTNELWRIIISSSTIIG